MELIPQTLFYTPILAFMYATLTLMVMALRTKNNTFTGDGDNPLLFKSIRAHGNFSEYVPFIIVLLGLLEFAEQNNAAFISKLFLILIISRVLHIMAMFLTEKAVIHFICRSLGIGGTVIVIIVGAYSLFALS